MLVSSCGRAFFVVVVGLSAGDSKAEEYLTKRARDIKMENVEVPEWLKIAQCY